MKGGAGGDPFSALKLAVAGMVLVAVAAVGGLIYMGTKKAPVAVAVTALAGLAGTATGALASMLVSWAPAPMPGGRRAGDPPGER